jgi:hypothetical protein
MQTMTERQLHNKKSTKKKCMENLTVARLVRNCIQFPSTHHAHSVQFYHKGKAL